jgi:hypothetical protein
MYFDRDDVRGLVRFSGVIALVVAIGLFWHVSGWQGGFRKDRASGAVYVAPDRPLERAYLPHAIGGALLGIVLLAASAGRPREKKEPIQLPETTRGKRP